MKVFVTVKTNARENKVERIDANHFKVSTIELPIKSRANLAIIDLLSDFFNIPKSKIQISSGFSSKQKVFEIPK